MRRACGMLLLLATSGEVAFVTRELRRWPPGLRRRWGARLVRVGVLGLTAPFYSMGLALLITSGDGVGEESRVLASVVIGFGIAPALIFLGALVAMTEAAMKASRASIEEYRTQHVDARSPRGRR